MQSMTEWTIQIIEKTGVATTTGKRHNAPLYYTTSILLNIASYSKQHEEKENNHRLPFAFIAT